MSGGNVAKSIGSMAALGATFVLTACAADPAPKSEPADSAAADEATADVAVSADAAKTGETAAGSDAVADAVADAAADAVTDAVADAVADSAADTVAPSDTASGGCPQAAALLVMTNAAGAGDNYAKPQLSGSCADGKFTVVSNGMPTYQFVAMTPNALKPQNWTWSIPAEPKVADKTTAIPQLGLVGFSVAGMPFYGPNEGPQPTDSAYGDPVYNNITDGCFGHTAQNGDYHQHAFAVKCLTQAAVPNKMPWTSADEDGSKPSPIVGFAMDGFAIYGPWGCTDAACAKPVKFQSGYKKVGDPKTNAWQAYSYQANAADPTVLDACNGRTGPDGVYRYHATSGFPYILGCYKGTATGAGGGGTTDPGGNTGPQSCTADSDCVGAKCPTGAKAGCKCEKPPQEAGKICVPKCATNSDCPAPNGQTGKCDTATGICQKPAGGGPPP